VAVLALASAQCSFPTDKSDGVFVTLEAPSHVVLRGQEMDVYARAWRVVGVDTQPIGNVDFAFNTGSSTTARVEKTCCGYATVIGVNRGDVDIVARAVAFEQAGQANLVIRVANPLEIDSVRPSPVHFGELLTVYGVGVDSMFIASLAGVNLIEYPFSRTRDSATGLGQIKFWVPPPARSDRLFYLGAGVFGTDTVVTNVFKEDVYEPNDSVASLINLDLPGPWPGTILAPILFTNPALAFEPQDRDVEGWDWFKFTRSDTTRPTTFFINYPSFGTDSLTRTFVIDSMSWNGSFSFPPVVGFIGSKWHYCKNRRFQPIQVSRESTIVALKELPSKTVTILTFFSNPQRYGLTAVDGYITTDSRIGPDRFEENDYCKFADRPAQRIPPSPGILALFTDTLTIDNPFDIDWYVINMPAPTAGPDSALRIRVAPRPFAVQDSSDIDVYVLSFTTLNQIASSEAAGSFEDFTVNLGAGLYYVAVVDYAGTPTRYSMCMRAHLTVLSCVLQAAPPRAAIHYTPKQPRPAPTLRAPSPSAPLAPDESPLGRVRRP
jgi:hypothetical protein